MRMLLCAVSAALISACSTERIEIIHEMVGCEADAECDDRDDQTLDWCEADSGFCNHERTVEAGLCTSVADCDDGDAETVDACEGGDCHHTREVEAPRDPRDYQDLLSFCEQPLSCESVVPEGGTYAAMPYTRCTGEREPWNEDGYFLWVELFGPTDVRTLRIRPELRAGDPDDLFRIRVHVDDVRLPPVLVQDVTAEALATDGIAVPVAPPTDGSTWYTEDVVIYITFADPEVYRSRALQWALPIGSVADAESGTNFIGCPQVGRYIDVPEHGLLRLAEDPGGGTPRCEGVVRGPEPWYAASPDARPSGLFRTVSDPTLRYGTDLEIPQRIFEFRSMREFIDWFRFPPDPRWHPYTICANAVVVPDETYAAARLTATVEQVGARPGTMVSWVDLATGVRRYGVADRQWTIRDIGTDPSVRFAWGGLLCSSYSVFRRDYSGSCEVDLGWTSGYVVVPTDPATIDPAEIDETSGWLYWYNHDMPAGP